MSISFVLGIYVSVSIRSNGLIGTRAQVNCNEIRYTHVHIKPPEQGFGHFTTNYIVCLSKFEGQYLTL